MIVGNNNFKKMNTFINNNHNQNNINSNNNQHSQPILNNNQSIMQHSNVLNKDEMTDRAFRMLNERLRNGTITIEEFNKRCRKLGKNNQK